MFEQGSYGPSGFNFASYCDTSYTFDKISDRVNTIRNWVTQTIQITTAGTGATGTQTVNYVGVSQYGSRSVETVTNTGSVTVSLTAPVLNMPPPSTRVTPMMTPLTPPSPSGRLIPQAALMGTNDTPLPQPWGGGVEVQETLGAANGWYLDLNSKPGGPGLQVDMQVLQGSTANILPTWLQQLASTQQPALMPGQGPGLLYSCLQPGLAPLFYEVNGSYVIELSRMALAQQTLDPLGLESARLWENIVDNGGDMSLNYGWRSAEFVAGAVNTLSGGRFTDVVGFLISPALYFSGGWQAILDGTGASGLINTNSRQYQYGGYAGEAVLIALTVTGASGPLVSAIWASQAISSGLNAADALAQGDLKGAAFNLGMAAVALAHLKTPSGVATIGESVTSAIFGEGQAAQVAGVIGKGISRAALGFGVGMNLKLAAERFKQGDIVGGMLSLGQAGADIFAASRSCFTADMLIDVEGGKKRADAIEIGDWVWSRDEFDPSAPAVLKRVLERYVRVAEIWQVDVAGQRIRTTAEHPFYVLGRGWIPAKMLEIGDVLLTRCGKVVVVAGVANSGRVETVYNWQVAEYHTYFVSATLEGDSVWAHNAAKYTAWEGDESRNTYDRIFNKPKWPATANEMDRILGMQGTSIPDGPMTPGRNKIVWEPAAGITITFEQHPYHPNAPAWHRGPHFHLDTPGAPHVRYLPGETIPGF